MKDLIIPNKVENAFNLSDINIDFKGLIIAYKDKEAVGYINWYDDCWSYCTSINYEDPYQTCDTLKECLEWVLDSHSATYFKVIEFK